MKRLSKVLYWTLPIVLLAAPLLADVGIYLKSDCTTIPSPQIKKTWCMDSTSGEVKYWDGSVYVNHTATNFSSLGTHLRWATDNAFDIGASGANRPRDLFLGRNLSLAGDVTIGDQLIVSGAGPHAIGAATNANVGVLVGGALALSTATAEGIRFAQALTPGVGFDAYVIRVSPGNITKAGSGAHTDFVAMLVEPAGIVGGAATVTNASTLKITGAPTGATNNYALWVAGGATRLDGVLSTRISGADRTYLSLGGANELQLGDGGGFSGILFFPGSAEKMRLTNAGILALGTTVTAGAAAGELVLPLAKTLRGVDVSLTTTFPLAQTANVGGATAAVFGGTGLVSIVRTSKVAPTSADGDWWVEVVGTSPSRVAAIKVNDAGTVRTIASLTF